MKDDDEITTTTVAETPNYIAWTAKEPDGEDTYHLELGSGAPPFFSAGGEGVPGARPAAAPVPPPPWRGGRRVGRSGPEGRGTSSPKPIGCSSSRRRSNKPRRGRSPNTAPAGLRTLRRPSTPPPAPGAGR